MSRFIWGELPNTQHQLSHFITTASVDMFSNGLGHCCVSVSLCTHCCGAHMPFQACQPFIICLCCRDSHWWCLCCSAKVPVVIHAVGVLSHAVGVGCQSQFQTNCCIGPNLQSRCTKNEVWPHHQCWQKTPHWLLQTPLVVVKPGGHQKL